MERLRRLYPDPVLLFTVILLTLMGLLSVVSVKIAPHIFSDLDVRHFRRPVLFLLSAVVGVFLMSFISYAFNYRKLNNQRVIYALVGISLLLLLMVLVKKVALGKSVDRWLIGTSVQPSELSRLVVVVFIAYYVSRKGYIDKLRFFGWAILVVLAHSLLLFLQPDKGMAIFVMATAWLLLWIGGSAPKVYLPVAGLFTAVALFMLLFGGEYVHRRILAWRDPMEDSFGSGYQVIQSLLAFMNGGLLGQGYGKGFQKLGSLTQADTDYVLATVGEELGFPGILFLFVLYGVLVWRLSLIARSAADTFGRLVVVGVMLNILIAVMVNTMMAVNILPPKGMPLPFVSYGVSNMLATFLSLGLVGAVYKRQLRFRAL